MKTIQIHNLNKTQLKQASWNVRGVYEEKEVKNLIGFVKKYKLNLLIHLETKLKETGFSECDSSVLNSGGNSVNRLSWRGILSCNKWK